MAVPSWYAVEMRDAPSYIHVLRLLPPRNHRHLASMLLVCLMLTAGLSLAQAPPSATLEHAEKVAQTDAKRAIAISNAVLQAAIESTNLTQQAAALRVLAIARYFEADFPRALENAVAAERLYEQLDNPDRRASLLSLMGAIHGGSKQPERALDVYRRALEVSRAANVGNGEAIVLMNIGKTYFDLGRYDEAVEHYEQSIARFEALQASGGQFRPDALLFARMGIADALLRIGEPEQTIERAAAVLSASDSDSLVYQNALAILGEAHIELGDFEAAQSYLDRALDEAQRTRRPVKRVETMGLLATLAERRGEFKQALELQRAVNDINLEIYNEQNSTELARLESRYESDLRDQQIALQESQLQRNRSTILATSTAAVAALLLALILLQLYRVKQRSHQALRVLAETDPLTGLLNRRTMYEALSITMSTNNDIALCLLDIDNFKSVNDQYGHAVGDRVLVTVAQTIVKNLRATDKVCRWGGEEFLVLLLGRTREESVTVARRLRDQLAQIRFDEFETISVTASFGVAHFTPETTDAELIQRADAAMYRAKSAGKNQVTVS